MLPDKKKEVLSTLFGYAKNTLLASYVPKRNNAVILLSTQHTNFDISEHNMKPEVILEYNATKSGVVTLDMMSRQYTIQRGTKRWPLAIFYDIVDMAAINAYVLHTMVSPTISKKKGARGFSSLV